MQHGFVRGVRLEREKVPDVGRYPFDIPAVGDLEPLDLDPGVTFFIGENGSGYEDTEHVQITRDFLDEPGRFLEHLLEE